MSDREPPNPANKSQRLGRGLEALLGSLPARAPAQTADAGAATSRVQDIPLASVVVNPTQPRQEFNERELDELAASLGEHGLLQPIIVRPKGNGFEIVAGERRMRAAKRLGWESIPALIRPVDDRASLTLALVENLQRADLNPIEEAEGYQQLIDEFGLTQQQIADAVGKDRSTIANALRLQQLPASIRAMLTAGQLTMGHARALLAVEGETARLELARHAVTRGYTVRDLERLAKAPNPAAPVKSASKTGSGSQREAGAVAHSAEIQRISDALRRHLQTDVRVESSDGMSGEVHIRFYSPDDLERILDQMLGSARHNP
jgi:ParB family transcriptional regulator, chromosome partitioning protein